VARQIGPYTPVEPVSGPVLRAARERPVEGLSRRTLLRAALGTAIGLWVTEAVAGTLGFAWSAVAHATPTVVVGTFDDLIAANPSLPIRDGFPAYVAAARAFVVLVDPGRGGWLTGVDPTGERTTMNVRTL
jgi:hypothetical protein